MTGPIIAIGGAEFAMRPENEALHDYVLSFVGSPKPRICLLPTASGDPHEQIRSFHSAMERRGAVASDVSLFRLGVAPMDLAKHLLSQDAIYVTGGSMVNLLALWREHRLDEIMQTAHERGILLCGYSAGSMCWFGQGVSRGAGAPAAVPGLGLIKGSHCVHYAQDPARRDAYRRLVGSEAIPGGLALDDHSAALIREGEMVEAVRSKESAGAFRVEPDGSGEVTEERLDSRLLPAPEAHEEPGLEEMRQLRRFHARSATTANRIGRNR